MKKKLFRGLQVCLLLAAILYGHGFYLTSFNLKPLKPAGGREPVQDIQIGNARFRLPGDADVSPFYLEVDPDKGGTGLIREFFDKSDFVVVREYLDKGPEKEGKAFSRLMENDFDMNRAKFTEVRREDVSSEFAGLVYEAAFVVTYYEIRDDRLKKKPTSAGLPEELEKAEQKNLVTGKGYDLIFKMAGGALHFDKMIYKGTAIEEREAKKLLLAAAQDFFAYYHWTDVLKPHDIPPTYYLTPGAAIDFSSVKVGQMYGNITFTQGKYGKCTISADTYRKNPQWLASHKADLKKLNIKQRLMAPVHLIKGFRMARKLEIIDNNDYLDYKTYMLFGSRTNTANLNVGWHRWSKSGKPNLSVWCSFSPYMADELPRAFGLWQAVVDSAEFVY